MSAPDLSLRQPEPLPDTQRSPGLAVSLAVSALLLLLVWEWLRPLPELSALTELYDIRPFIGAFALVLLMDGLQIAPRWSAPLKAAVAIFLVGRLFYPDQFAGLSWLGSLAEQVRDDVLLAAHGDYEQIGGQTRTLLFVAGWTMMTSVLHALLLQRQVSLWLGGMTLLYLLSMQLCFGIDTVDGIWRTFVWSGLLTALLLPGKLERRYGVAVPGFRSWGWTLAAAAVIAACVAAASFGWRPQHDGRLMKPLDYTALERWASSLGWTAGAPLTAPAGVLSALPAKTGYSLDDTALGGPVIPDSSVVFEAKTSELTYWRGESKSTYDGKGWSQSLSRLEAFTPLAPEPPENQIAGTVQQEIMLQPSAATRLLFLGGTLSSADALVTSKDRMLQGDLIRYDAASGAYSLPELSDPAVYYKVSIVAARPNEAELRGDGVAYPADIAETYLQLPSSLPQRVRDLAARITADAPDPYDKAAAIAQYLKSNYAYSYEQAAVPGPNEDFVDRFLFVGKTGYCDYFSTAMAVMLRTVGVPTRWVKGFAPGMEQTPSGSPDKPGVHDVVVRNQDAHSWVEVYFPKSGWVAFDPTPGFGGAGMAEPGADRGAGEHAGFSPQSSSVTEATLGNLPVPQPFDPSNGLSLDPGVPAAPAAISSVRTALSRGLLAAYDAIIRAWKGVSAWTMLHAALAAGTAIAVLAAAAFLYRYRRSLSLAALAIRAGHPAAGEPQSSSVVFMELLWTRLYRRYGRKAPQETTREYVSRLHLADEARQSALYEFVKLYELARYDTSRRLPVSRRMLLRLWERIVETK